MMERHFVTFYSPGTFVHETTTKPIDSWSPAQAHELARDVKERYNQRPFGFKFTTRAREDDELDSRVVNESGMYYLGGKLETIEEVTKREPDSILASNMKCNGWKQVLKTPGGSTQLLRGGDVILEAL